MRNKFIFLFIVLMLAISFASAKDIAYVVKDSKAPNQYFVNAMNELNFTYDIIQEPQIASTNFSKYKVVLVGEGNFRTNANLIPVNTKPSLIVNTYHMNTWNWISDGVSQVASSQPLKANVVDNKSLLVQGIPLNFQVYTQARYDGHNIPMYYLPKSKISTKINKVVSTENDKLNSVIAVTKKGTVLKNGKVSNARGVFFGITESTYWTADSKKLFKNSLKWLVNDEDLDRDNYPSDIDCNDSNPSIHPGAGKIPYDLIDQNCDGYDLGDGDGDGYCKEGYSITNKTKQCAKETGIVGTDCNDNDKTYFLGATDSAKNCINEAPTLIKQIPMLEWSEDTSFTLNLITYFKDPDGDSLNYTIQSTSDNEGITIFLLANGVIKFESVENWNGQDWVIFKAEDPKGLSVSSNNVTLIVLSENDAPVLDLIVPVFVSESQVVQIIANANDVDGNNLTYSINSNKFEQNGNVFTWQTKVGDVGDHEFEVAVSDGHGGTDTQIVQVGVFEKIYINEFVSNPSSGNEWVELYNPGKYTFLLDSCSLFDGADHELELNGNVKSKGFAVFNYNSGVLNNEGDIIKLYCYGTLIDSITYGNWDDGNVNDNAPAPENGESAGRDPDGKDTRNNKNNFKIYKNPTKGLPNNADVIPPVVTLVNPINNQYFNETRDIEFEFKATDNLASQMDCSLYLNSILKGSKEATNSSVEKITVLGIVDGSYSWNVKCSDEFVYAYAPDNRSFTINAPDIPLIEFVDDKTVNEGQTLEFKIYAFDNDGGSLTLSIENRPDGSNFMDDGNRTGSFSWTPNFNQAGDYVLQFKVADNTSLQSIREVKVKVIDIKEPPQFSDAERCLVKSDKIVLTIKKPDKSDDFTAGETIKGDIKVENKFAEDLEFDVKAYFYNLDEEESIEDDSDSVDIDAGKYKQVKIDIDVPDDIELDDDNFAYYVYVEDDEGRCNSGFIKINIDRKEKDVIIKSFGINPKIVYPGSNIEVDVKLENRGSKDQDAYITIENSELKIYEKSEEFEIEKYDDDDKITRSFSITIPKGAEEKDYELTATVVYDGEEQSKTQSFMVSKGQEFIVTPPKKEKVVPGNVIRLGGIDSGKVVYTNYENEGYDRTKIVTERQIIEKKEVTQKSQVNIDVKGLKTNDLLLIIDIFLIIGIIIEIILIRVVTSRRR